MGASLFHAFAAATFPLALPSITFSSAPSTLTPVLTASSFMNAFTSSDWTAYPFATQNRKDFGNLLDVYLDAVFFSRLDPLDFAQEGHRVEFENDDSNQALVFKGVVFNEMKDRLEKAHSQAKSNDKIFNHFNDQLLKARTLAADAMLAYRLLTYPGTYLEENPSLDRMSETVEKIFEDLREVSIIFSKII